MTLKLLGDERYTARIVNEAARRPSFPSRSAKTTESGEMHTYVLTPVNEDVYAKQYENEDAEAQTT